MIKVLGGSNDEAQGLELKPSTFPLENSCLRQNSILFCAAGSFLSVVFISYDWSAVLLTQNCDLTFMLHFSGTYF